MTHETASRANQNVIRGREVVQVARCPRQARKLPVIPLVELRECDAARRDLEPQPLMLGVARTAGGTLGNTGLGQLRDSGYWQIDAPNGTSAIYSAYGNARATIKLPDNGVSRGAWNTPTSGLYAGALLTTTLPSPIRRHTPKEEGAGRGIPDGTVTRARLPPPRGPA